MHNMACTINMDSSVNEKSKCLSMLQEMCNIQSEKLLNIWSIIGHKHIEEKIKTLCEKMDQRLQDLIVEEANYEYYLAIKIEKKLKEAAKLCSEVGVSYESVTAKLEDLSIPLLQVEKILNERLQKCRECKEERIRRYNELLCEEQKICDTLMIPKRQKFLRVPRECDLEEFAAYIAQKEAEEKKGKQKFEQLQQEVIKITSELKCSPNSSFHKTVLTDRNLSFTKENLNLLSQLHTYLKDHLERAKEESAVLRDKLCELWEHLGVELDIREMFLKQYCDNSMPTIGALKAEIGLCEDKRRDCIKTLVFDLRQTLNDWWDKVCFGKKQRRKFKPFFIDCFTEDLLELHNLEIEKVKTYYMENNEILLLAERLDLLWKKLIELQQCANDPKRLFTNRGGTLLKEERERKTVQKDIPLVEKQIKNLLERYEEQFGEPFIYKDEDLRDKMKAYWINFQKQRQELKGSRNKPKEHLFIEVCPSHAKRKYSRLLTPSTIPRRSTKTLPTLRSAKTTSSTPPRSRFRRMYCRSAK